VCACACVCVLYTPYITETLGYIGCPVGTFISLQSVSVWSIRFFSCQTGATDMNKTQTHTHTPARTHTHTHTHNHTARAHTKYTQHNTEQHRTPTQHTPTSSQQSEGLQTVQRHIHRPHTSLRMHRRSHTRAGRRHIHLYTHTTYELYPTQPKLWNIQRLMRDMFPNMEELCFVSVSVLCLR